MTDDGVGTTDGPDVAAGSDATDGRDAETGGGATDDDAGASSSTYGGLVTAFPYALRESDSRAFTLYAALSGLLSIVLGFYFAAAVTVAVSNTLGAGGGTFTFVRSFYVFVAFGIVAPIVGAVLFAAREHRHGRGDPVFDRRMAVLGFVYLVALYFAAVISMPPTFTLDGETVTRPEPAGVVAPLISVLYAMPPLSSILPPALVGVAMYLLDRRHDASASTQ
jgi:hypothetical protein